MRLRVENDENRSRYEAFADDERAGYLSYRREQGMLALDHTDVRERFEGEGIGSALVRRALDDARESGLAVLPFCPFANDYLKRHAEYADLVPGAERERFGLE